MWWLLMACATRVAPQPAPEPVIDFPAAPEVGTPDVWAPAAPARSLLGELGPVLHLHTDRSLPLVNVRVLVPGGSVNDPAGKYGRCSLGAELMNEGVGELDALARADALATLAAEISASCGRESVTVQLDVGSAQLPEAMALLADTLMRPAFDEADVARVQEQHVLALRSNLDAPPSVAGEVARTVVFGPEHPYGTPPDGTPESVAALAAKDLRTWHQETVTGGGVEVAVAGDIDAETFTALWTEHLGAWTGNPAPRVTVPPVTPKPGFWFVDMPGSSQTAFRIVHPGPAGTSEDLGALDLSRIIVGGTFTSRLNRRLREELGYTYGARLAVTQYREAGMVQAYAGIRADATVHALQEFQRLLGEAATDGFSEEEMQKAHAMAVTNAVDGAETVSSLTGTYIGEVRAGRDPAALLEGAKAQARVDAAGAQAALARWMDVQQASVVLVGDAETVLPALEAAGFTEFVQVDRTGAPVAAE